MVTAMKKKKMKTRKELQNSLLSSSNPSTHPRQAPTSPLTSTLPLPQKHPTSPSPSSSLCLWLCRSVCPCSCGSLFHVSTSSSVGSGPSDTVSVDSDSDDDARAASGDDDDDDDDPGDEKMRLHWDDRSTIGEQIVTQAMGMDSAGKASDAALPAKPAAAKQKYPCLILQVSQSDSFLFFFGVGR